MAKRCFKIILSLSVYNILNGTNFELDIDAINEVLNDPVKFAILQDQALAIRSGDAFSDVAQTIMGDTLLQPGGYAHLDYSETALANIQYYRDGSRAITTATEELEALEFTDTLYQTGRQPIVLDLSNFTDAISARIHAGELNVLFNDLYTRTGDGKSYYAKAVPKMATFAPICTTAAIFERVGEVITYDHCDSRTFEIALPSSIQGTQIANVFESEVAIQKASMILTTLGYDFDDHKYIVMSPEKLESSINAERIKFLTGATNVEFRSLGYETGIDGGQSLVGILALTINGVEIEVDIQNLFDVSDPDFKVEDIPVYLNATTGNVKIVYSDSPNLDIQGAGDSIVSIGQSINDGTEITAELPIVKTAPLNTNELDMSGLSLYANGLDFDATSRNVPFEVIKKIASDANLEAILLNGNLYEEIEGYDKVALGQVFNQLVGNPENAKYLSIFDEETLARIRKYAEQLNLTKEQIIEYRFNYALQQKNGVTLDEFFSSKAGAEAFSMAIEIARSFKMTGNIRTEASNVLRQVDFWISSMMLNKKIIKMEETMFTQFERYLTDRNVKKYEDYKYVNELAIFNNYSTSDYFKQILDILTRVENAGATYSSLIGLLPEDISQDLAFFGTEDGKKLFDAAQTLNEVVSVMNRFSLDNDIMQNVKNIISRMESIVLSVYNNEESGDMIQISPYILEIIARDMISSNTLRASHFDYFNKLLAFNNNYTFSGKLSVDFENAYKARILERDTAARLSKFFGSLVSTEKIESIFNSIKFATDEEMNNAGKDANVGGYNNGKTSVIRVSYDFKTLVSIVNHESLHQVSHDEIVTATGEHLMQAGLKIYNYNSGTSTYTGINEAVTEFLNYISMGADYAEFGYPMLLSTMKKLVNLGVFDVEMLKTAYITHDTLSIFNAVQKFVKDNKIKDFWQSFYSSFDKYATAKSDTEFNEAIKEITAFLVQIEQDMNKKTISGWLRNLFKK